jgi:hypothetical protein
MKPTLINTDIISTKIYFFREEKVLLDIDLAQLYCVEVKRLKEAVRRNIARFPADFMFELTDEEWQPLRTQIASLKKGRGNYPKYPPFAFTEQGVAVLSGILNSPRAIETNIAIMRTFVELRKWMQSNKELAAKIKQLENKYDEQFKTVFDAISQLIQQETKKPRPIGFKTSNSKR